MDKFFDLGDRMKMYESVSTSRKAFKGQPLMARLDGRSFHTFTKGLPRPYDGRLTELMIETTKHLVSEFQANIGYVQSDEISLSWYVPVESKSEYIFDGRFQKLESVLAASASVFFNRNLFKIPEKEHLSPIFDCRAWVVPSLNEVVDTFVWRQQDCQKNAISMAAHSMFSFSEVQGLNGKQMKEKMFSERGVNFSNYPEFFKDGTFVKKTKQNIPLNPDIVEKLKLLGKPIPEMVERSIIVESNEILSRNENPIKFLFENV